MEVVLCERVNDLRHSLFHHLSCLITTASELKELAKVTGINVWTTGRLRNCLDAHLGQIVYDKDGVVDWCIVQVEMPLTRFEASWPLPTKSSSWTPYIITLTLINPNPLANQLLCIDFLTPPTLHIIPHMPSLNLLCHTKTDARFTQDGSKVVWSIPYVSVA